jgi:hypothetical protein
MHYLAHQSMFVDVWDADSLHLIGTCTLQLKDLLRHGKEAVQSTHELHVLSTEYDDETRMNSANTVRTASQLAQQGPLIFLNDSSEIAEGIY